MRTFITGDMLCNDGDKVSGVEKCESGLEARYTCSLGHGEVSIQGVSYDRRAAGTQDRYSNYPRTTTCLAFGFA